MALTRKCLWFACLVCMAAPIAKVDAQLLGDLLGLIRIDGTLFCTLNANITNTTATPVFSNASVQLQCGSGNVIISSGTTNGAGVFSIVLNPLQVLVSTLVNRCNLVVNTPLASCNASLPSVGSLMSPLRVVGSTALGLLNIVNVVPTGFLPIP